MKMEREELYVATIIILVAIIIVLSSATINYYKTSKIDRFAKWALITYVSSTEDKETGRYYFSMRSIPFVVAYEYCNYFPEEKICSQVEKALPEYCRLFPMADVCGGVSN